MSSRRSGRHAWNRRCWFLVFSHCWYTGRRLSGLVSDFSYFRNWILLIRIWGNCWANGYRCPSELPFMWSDTRWSWGEVPCCSCSQSSPHYQDAQLIIPYLISCYVLFMPYECYRCLLFILKCDDGSYSYSYLRSRGAWIFIFGYYRKRNCTFIAIFIT